VDDEQNDGTGWRSIYTKKCIMAAKALATCNDTSLLIEATPGGAPSASVAVAVGIAIAVVKVTSAIYKTSHPLTSTSRLPNVYKQVER
jgi:hypothetical protein